MVVMVEKVIRQGRGREGNKFMIYSRFSHSYSFLYFPPESSAFIFPKIKFKISYLKDVK